MATPRTGKPKGRPPKQNRADIRLNINVTAESHRELFRIAERLGITHNGQPSPSKAAAVCLLTAIRQAKPEGTT
jgi:hypothetical protein